MFAVWHWELPNGARVYTDGCFAPADGGDPSRSSTSATTCTGSTGRQGAELRTRRRRRHRAGRARRSRPRRWADDRARGRRPVGAALRAVRRRAQRDDGAIERGLGGHRDLRGHRRPPPPLLPGRPRRGPPQLTGIRSCAFFRPFRSVRTAQRDRRGDGTWDGISRPIRSSRRSSTGSTPSSARRSSRSTCCGGGQAYEPLDRHAAQDRRPAEAARSATQGCGPAISGPSSGARATAR